MSAENVYENYMEHFRFQNVNEVTAVNDLLYAQNADEESEKNAARLMDTYDKMDSDLGFAAAGDYVAGVLSAPSTYAGIFTGGGAKDGALAAQQGVLSWVYVKYSSAAQQDKRYVPQRQRVLYVLAQ